MSKNSPSARLHRALRFLAHVQQYRQYGPFVGPKEAHQPDFRWPTTPARVASPQSASTAPSEAQS